MATPIKTSKDANPFTGGQLTGLFAGVAANERLTKYLPSADDLRSARQKKLGEFRL